MKCAFLKNEFVIFKKAQFLNFRSENVTLFCFIKMFVTWKHWPQRTFFFSGFIFFLKVPIFTLKCANLSNGFSLDQFLLRHHTSEKDFPACIIFVFHRQNIFIIINSVLGILSYCFSRFRQRQVIMHQIP